MQTNYVDQRSMEISIILLVCYNGLLISVCDESNVENIIIIIVALCKDDASASHVP